MAPPAPLGGRLGRLKLAPSPRILSSAALKSSPEGPQLLLPLPPRSWGISFGSGGPPSPPAATPSSSSPPGAAAPGDASGCPVRARSPVLAFRTALTKRHAGAPRTEACSLAVQSGGRKPRILGWAGPCSLWWREGRVLPSPPAAGSPGIPGLWPHPSRLCFRGHTSFSPGSPLFLRRHQ